MKTVALSQFRTNPSRFVDQEVVVTQNDRPLFRVTPVPRAGGQEDLQNIKFGLRLIASMMSDGEQRRAQEQIAELRFQTVGEASLQASQSSGELTSQPSSAMRYGCR